MRKGLDNTRPFLIYEEILNIDLLPQGCRWLILLFHRYLAANCHKRLFIYLYIEASS